MTSAEIAHGLALALDLLREYADTLDGRQLEDTQADEITLAQAAVEAALQEQRRELDELRAENERLASRLAEIEGQAEAQGQTLDGLVKCLLDAYAPEGEPIPLVTYSGVDERALVKAWAALRNLYAEKP